MNRVKFAGVTAACAVGLVTIGAASADSIGQIKLVQGSAMISQGAEYVAAREGMQLQELDRILVMEDSTATLAFNDGCEYTMADSEILTVGAESVCAAQAAAPSIEAIEKGATSQLGYAAGGATGLYILGGLGAAGLIAAAADGLGSDDRPPAAARAPLSP
jgi:hypothetical protein